MLVSQLLSEGKRRSDLEYTPTEVKGKVERLTVKLSGSDSKSFTTLAKKYDELDQSIKALDEEKKKLNAQIREKVLDIFDAEDDILTRVVETVSFTATVAKQSAAPSKTDYETIVAELVKMVPDLKSKVDALTKTYTKIGKASQPALRVDALKEDFAGTILGFISKTIASFKSWASSYSNKLDKLKSKFAVIAEKPALKEEYEDHGDYSSADAGTASAKNDAKEGWVDGADIGTPAKDKALAKHLKVTVGASKEFIDAYIAQLYKSFKK